MDIEIYFATGEGGWKFSLKDHKVNLVKIWIAIQTGQSLDSGKRRLLAVMNFFTSVSDKSNFKIAK